MQAGRGDFPAHCFDRVVLVYNKNEEARCLHSFDKWLSMRYNHIGKMEQ